MDKYSTSCTKEQTEKAYRLGAPLKKHKGIVYTNTEKSFYVTYKGENLVKIDKSYFHIPTTEQMCGWLRDTYGICCSVRANYGMTLRYHIEVENCKYDKIVKVYIFNTYEQAIHAAVDYALDYLEKGE